MVTPRKPDRYGKRVGELARHVEELIFDGDEECGSRLRWSLRRMAEEVEAETLERAAQFVDDEDEGRTGRGFELGDVGDFRKRCVAGIRALASPAAAPAAETKVCVCRYLDGAEFMGKCPAHPAPPSEPAAPAADLRAWRLVGPFRISAPAQGAEAPDLRRVVERAQVELDRRDARIAELEAALRELTRAATEHANAHGCSGDLGARLSDAKALLAARTSQGGAGEGT